MPSELSCKVENREGYQLSVHYGSSSKVLRFRMVLTEGGAGSCFGVNDGDEMSERSWVEMESFRQGQRAAHLELGENTARHLVDLTLNTSLQNLHQARNGHRVGGNSQSVDFQRKFD